MSIIAIDAELVEAMRKLGATPEEMIMADGECPEQAYEMLEYLGAGSDLLNIVRCIGAANGQWVVDSLHRWNMERP